MSTNLNREEKLNCKEDIDSVEATRLRKHALLLRNKAQKALSVAQVSYHHKMVRRKIHESPRIQRIREIHNIPKIHKIPGIHEIDI